MSELNEHDFKVLMLEAALDSHCRLTIETVDGRRQMRREWSDGPVEIIWLNSEATD